MKDSSNESDDAQDGAGGQGGEGGFAGCEPGTFLEGDASDVCTKCPSGTFSGSANASECVAWSECAAGFVESMPGTASSDRSCSVLEWTREFGEDTSAVADAVAVDDAGNVLVAGGADGPLSGQTSYGDYDAFVRKYDPDGIELWTTQFGTGEVDGAGAVLQSGNAIIVAGSTNGALPGYSNAGQSDAFLCKLDGDGSKSWCTQYGTSIGDGISVRNLEDDGSVLVSGGSTDVSGIEPDQSFLAKFDTAGALLWKQDFSVPEGAYMSLRLDAEGNVFGSGSISGTALPGQTALGGDDVFVRKHDAMGNELWTRQFGTEKDDVGYKPRVDHAGNVLVYGTTEGALPGQASAGLHDMFVRKYDSDGNLLWTRQFGTAEYEFPGDLTVDAGDNVLIAGRTSGTFAGQTSTDGHDIFVVKYDADGNRLWLRQFDIEGDDDVYAIATDKNGAIFVAGEAGGGLTPTRAFVMRLAP